MGKTSSFVFNTAFGTILGIAFFVSIGSISARADDVDPNNDTSILDRPDYDQEHPWYQLAPSRWSVGIRAAIDSFPMKTGIGNSYQLYGEWMLPFQKAGLFSVGGHFGVFPLNNSNHNLSAASVPYPNYQSGMGGLQLRYQMRYLKNQVLVPTAAVEWDYYRLILGTGYDNATGSIFGFSAGVMLNLGWIDRDTAREAYSTLGMTRAYLTFEIHPLTLTAPSIQLSGNFFYTGLRLEFE